jgi:hypothetical protein
MTCLHSRVASAIDGSSLTLALIFWSSNNAELDQPRRTSRSHPTRQFGYETRFRVAARSGRAVGQVAVKELPVEDVVRLDDPQVHRVDDCRS